MISQLALIRQQLIDMSERIESDKSLPNPEYAIEINQELNAARSALIRLDNVLHARHNERHPIKLPSDHIRQRFETRCLAPDVRADIDATP